MQHLWSIDGLGLSGSWLTIGSFDGVHLGHQKIVNQIVHGAREDHVPSVVLTFYPHPGVVLGKRSGAFYLTTPEEKAQLLAEMGLDYMISHPFNRQLAQLSARDFVSYLHQRLGFKRLCIGSDFALGHNREGDLPRLEQLGRQFGYRVQALQPVTLDGRVVSSSWVRQALSEGDVSTVQRLLSRPYQISGEVVHGDGRGKTLGIPTANLEVWRERALLKPGVYAGWAAVDGSAHPAVSNIGYRPTFDQQEEYPHVEAHIIDFDQDLYRKQVSLSFLFRLRDEQRFENIEGLVQQVHQDIEKARSLLEVSRHETISGIARPSS
ncbi:MAG: riboflavin biosynthesis protein RibF [Anaerolineae bacterium UTCFX2]|jgi:riboflavin kinase/FMN adenylyltransferase|nr:bifunctional riboflavin kinase/FAD synthetase [Anaerolineales bacterium]OQY93505.1 MAG: riboflavin biosynthesis protein RibF [Anaerolineae bacterium UTCFX2]